MKMNLCIPLALAGSCFMVSVPCLAQTNETSNANPNRFGLNFRMGFNVKASFRNLGGFAARTDPGPSFGGSVNRVYDDGFNRLDSSGNVGGMTWNWGYQNASQLPGNDTVLMHSYSSPATAVSDNRTDDPQPGLDLSYDRELGRLAKKIKWGVGAGFNYTSTKIQDSSSLSAPGEMISDAFALGGITAPLSPYSGSFGNAGPLISDSPARSVSTSPSGASITGERKLDANLYGIKLGPYLEYPLSSKFAVSLRGGFAAAYVDSEFQFNQVVSVSGIGTASGAGTGSDGGWLAGGFVAAGVSYQLTRALDLAVGVEYQNLGTFSQKAGGAEARLNLRDCIFITLGLGYSF